MDRISKAIKCVECKKILETPVLLPCHHSVCKKHASEAKNSGLDKLKCGECGVEHEIPVNEFPVIEALCEIIEAQIGSIDFGKAHKEATDSCNQLSQYIKKIEHLLNDPSAYIYEQVSELKNQVHTKSEQLKLKIDEETEKLLKKLSEYQNQCNSLLKSELYLSERNKHEATKNKFLTGLASNRDCLNELKFDEEKWTKITKKNKQAIGDLKHCLKELKSLLLKDLNSYKNYTVFFQNINIDSLFIQ